MLLLVLSFVAGFLTILAPCILPLLPVIVGGSVGGGVNLMKAFRVTVALTLSIVCFTLLIKASTILIDVPPSFWKWFSGLTLMTFGLVTLLPDLWGARGLTQKVYRKSNALLGTGYKKGGVWGDFVVGASLGPIFSSCSPVYFVLLAVVLPEHTFLGIVYLIAYACGLSLALGIVALMGQKVLAYFGVASDPHGIVKRVLALLFILVGLIIILGLDKKLEARILDAGFFDVTKIEHMLLERYESTEEKTSSLIQGEEESPTSRVNVETDSVVENTIIPPSDQEFGQGIQNESVTEDVVIEERVPVRAPTPVPTTVSSASRVGTREEKDLLYPRAQEIQNASGFITADGEPITLAELRGKVVLLSIWTYGCINCMRTLPYLNTWYETYKDAGLEIVGIHTPEFAYEKKRENVVTAAKAYGITYPIVLDNEYAIWKAYDNHYWPRRYIIDVDGYIIFDHIGEGAYTETEEVLKKALQERNARTSVISGS